jgi:membrane protein
MRDADRPRRERLDLAAEILKKTIEDFGRHECGLRAAALAYQGLLSIFPMLLFMIFLGSQVLRSDATRQTVYEFVDRALPAAADEVQQVVDQTLQARRSIGVISGVGLLWTASALFTNLTTSLNAIWQASPRSFWRKRAIALLIVLVLGSLFLISIALSIVASGVLPLNGDILRSWNLALDAFVATLFFWLLYRWLPNRRVSRRASLVGAGVATILWLAAKSAFTWLATSGLANYGLVYGSLASVILLALWAYYSGLVLYLGAVLGATLETTLWPGRLDRDR